MRHLGLFSTSRGETFTRGARVIARTSRGLESGEVLCDSTDQIATDLQDAKNGQILRRTSSQDELELKKMSEQEGREYDSCQKRIEELKLAMKLVDLEHLYGGERIIIYYLADGRVDFRELVKVLAGEFQTRIEMRQIGVRDEAKLLADYGDCGKPVCCNTHLSEMPPVSMRMAKLQKATLDPNKISGRCGRLKCCLRYEYETYQEMQKELPPIGSQVVTRTANIPCLIRLNPLPNCCNATRDIDLTHTFLSSRPLGTLRKSWDWGPSSEAIRSVRKQRPRGLPRPKTLVQRNLRSRNAI